MELVAKMMAQKLSSRHGSKLSGQSIGNSELDLNRQMAQSNDPQGMYIFGADGTPYAFCNDHDPEDLEKLMDIGLERFRQTPPGQVALNEADLSASFSITPPPDTQILQCFSRIPSAPDSVTYLNKGVGRDFCWIYKDELHEVAELASTGQEFPFPERITRRLARFHFLDGVRGTPNVWKAREVQSLSLKATPHGPHQLLLSGSFSMTTTNQRRYYRGLIHGTLTIDPITHTWSKVRILADGTASGAGTYTPNQPPHPYRLLVGLLETNLPEAQVVPPYEVGISNRTTRYKNP